MKKLLLTSNGLSSKKIRKEFLKLLEKPIEENKMLVMISKKHRTLKSSIKEFTKLGIKRKNIKFVNLRYIRKKIKKIEDVDIFFSYGGNTFYILDRVRKTGFDKIIKNFVKKGKLYIGLSAGSIIVHKTIESAGYGRDGDPNKIKLKNLKGLNLTNIAIFPHYKNKKKKEIDKFKKKVNYPIIRLKDKQAILILGNKVKNLF